MKIEVICPLYRGEKYIIPMYQSVMSQKGDFEIKLTFLLTLSGDPNDHSEDVLFKSHYDYKTIEKKDFSHSLTREKAALASDADIIVFVTQDVEIRSNVWLWNLTEDIRAAIEKHPKHAEPGDIVTAFSRQITKYDNIEKYTREKNYPLTSRVVSARDIERYGLNTFFSSDASSAIRASVFRELKGYDGRLLPISEDMYFCHKVIAAGYKVKYAANSEVYHSHRFSLRQTYDRYRLTGQFFAEVLELQKYNVNESGWDLAKYVFSRAVKERNFKVMSVWLPNMAARFLGMRAGKRENVWTDLKDAGRSVEKNGKRAGRKVKRLGRRAKLEVKDIRDENREDYAAAKRAIKRTAKKVAKRVAPKGAKR